MKASTEMERKKENALILRYFFPQKLACNTARVRKIKARKHSTQHSNTPKTPKSYERINKTDTFVVPSSSDYKTGVVCLSRTTVVLLNAKEVQTEAPPCEISMSSVQQRQGAKTTHMKMRNSSKMKKVSFQDCDEVFGILSRQEIAAPEVRNEIWYSRDEYEKIIQACSRQISMLDQGKLLKDKKFCARGLESHTRIQAHTRSMNRCLAYKAVLCEQERQVRAGFVVLDDKKIAQRYNAASYSSQLWAHVVGLADEREAKDIQDESDDFFLGQEGAEPKLLSSRTSSSAECELQERRVPEEHVARAA
jgi:hypothetical protein